MPDSPLKTKSIFDGRVLLWFFSWLGGFFLCSGGFVILVFLSPSARKFWDDNPLIFPVVCTVGVICFAFALVPWYFGIRCRQCRRKLFRMKTNCDIATGNTPLRFHCETCDIIWETKLISGPGDSRSTSHS